MGGLDSEITDDTVMCCLRSAYFERSSVRRTGRQLSLSVAAKKETDETTSQGNVLLSSRLADGREDAQPWLNLRKACG